MHAIKQCSQQFIEIRFDGWVDALDRLRTRQDELNAHMHWASENMISGIMSTLSDLLSPRSQLFVIGVIDIAPA